MRNKRGILDVCNQYVAYNAVFNVYSLQIDFLEACSIKKLFQISQMIHFNLNLPIELKPSLVPRLPRYLSFWDRCWNRHIPPSMEYVLRPLDDRVIIPEVKVMSKTWVLSSWNNSSELASNKYYSLLCLGHRHSCTDMTISGI